MSLRSSMRATLLPFAALVSAALLSAAPPVARAMAADPGVAADPASPHGAAGTATTQVILVRHAEKKPHPPGGDAGLDVRGLVRARELAAALGDADVAAIYASTFPRARLTAEPLARARGDSVRTYDPNRPDLLAARILAENRGRTVLVVGHSDTILPTIEALTGRPSGRGEAVPYPRMYVLTLAPDGSHALLRLRYGGETP